MGNPKFFFFPEPDGSQLVEIDLGEGLAEFFLILKYNLQRLLPLTVECIDQPQHTDK